MFVEIKIEIKHIIISREAGKAALQQIQKNLLPTTAAFEAMPAAMKPRTTSSQRKPMRPMIMTLLKMIIAVSLKLL
jgi:hypothetical protein